MTDNFNQWWQENRQRVLNENAEYRALKDSYKMKSGTDFLLYALPFVWAVWLLDWAPFHHEWLNWLAAAGIAVLLFVFATWCNTLRAGNRTLSDIEKEVKEKCRKDFENSSH